MILTDYKKNVIFFAMSTTARTDCVCFTTKGKLVIPAWLRRQFHIEPGTRAIVTAAEGGILLKPVTSALIDGGFGLLKSKAPGKPFAVEWADHKRAERKVEDAKDASRRSR